jgi:hypothetical protein
MPDEIDLSTEEEEALDRAWAKIEQEGRLQHGSPAAPLVVSPGGEQRRYPEPKQRELTDDEKEQIRQRIERGDGDIYQLAREFGCSSSQVAGIKAAMNR